MSQPSATKADSVKERKSAPKTLILEGDWPVCISQALVRDGRIPSLCVRLYAILVSHASSSQPLPFPSVETLMKESGVSRNTLQTALKELETWGLIVRYQPRCDAGTFASNRYKILPYSLNRTPKSKRRSKASPPCTKKYASSTVPYTEAKELVRTTPLPLTPSAPQHEYHKSHCDCFQCRQERNPPDF